MIEFVNLALAVIVLAVLFEMMKQGLKKPPTTFRVVVLTLAIIAGMASAAYTTTSRPTRRDTPDLVGEMPTQTIEFKGADRPDVLVEGVQIQKDFGVQQ